MVLSPKYNFEYFPYCFKWSVYTQYNSADVLYYGQNLIYLTRKGQPFECSGCCCFVPRNKDKAVVGIPACESKSGRCPLRESLHTTPLCSVGETFPYHLISMGFLFCAHLFYCFVLLGVELRASNVPVQVPCSWTGHQWMFLMLGDQTKPEIRSWNYPLSLILSQNCWCLYLLDKWAYMIQL